MAALKCSSSGSVALRLCPSTRPVRLDVGATNAPHSSQTQIRVKVPEALCRPQCCKGDCQNLSRPATLCTCIRENTKTYDQDLDKVLACAHWERNGAPTMGSCCCTTPQSAGAPVIRPRRVIKNVLGMLTRLQQLRQHRQLPPRLPPLALQQPQLPLEWLPQTQPCASVPACLQCRSRVLCRRSLG